MYINKINDWLEEISTHNKETNRIHREMWEYLKSVKHKLSPRQFTVLKLRLYKQLTYQEVAKILGVSHTRIRQIESWAIELTEEPVPDFVRPDPQPSGTRVSSV